MNRLDYQMPWWFVLLVMIALIGLLGLAARPCYQTFAAAYGVCPDHFVDNITDVGKVVNYCC